MEGERMLNRLLEANVLESAGDTIEIHSEFRETVEQCKNTPVTESPLDQETRDALKRDDNLFLTRFDALREHLSSLSIEDQIRILVSLDRFVSSVQAGGSPDGFLPIRGDRVRPLTTLVARSVVYVWLDDCDPCEIVKQDLEHLCRDLDPDGGIGLFSVYGPEWARVLREQYDVAGGPAILFMLGNTVDVRLYGPNARATVKHELEYLLELNTSEGQYDTQNV